MKKLLMMVACAALLSNGAVMAMSQDMSTLSETTEKKDEKKDEKKNPDDIVMVIELEAHTDVISIRSAMPPVGAGITAAGQLKVWSTAQLEALIRVVDVTGMDVAVASAMLAPGLDSVLGLEGIPAGIYTVEVSLSDGHVLSGTFTL